MSRCERPPARTFRHPPGMVSDLAAALAVRGRFIRLFAVGWALALAGFLITEPGRWLFLLVIGACLAGVVFVLNRGDRVLGADFGRLGSQHLVWEPPRLRQVDAAGHTVSEVDVSRPFEVSCPIAINGAATYRVTQPASGNGPGAVLEFASAIDDGSLLVEGVLQKGRWPPGTRPGRHSG